MAPSRRTTNGGGRGLHETTRLLKYFFFVILFLVVTLYYQNKHIIFHQSPQYVETAAGHPAYRVSSDDQSAGGSNDAHYKRVLFFCHCMTAEELDTYQPFSIALQRVPHLINDELFSSHVFSFKKGMNLTHLSCEDEIEKTLMISEHDNASLMVEIFYHSGFDRDCYKPRQIQSKTKINKPRNVHGGDDSSWKGGAHLVNHNQELVTRIVRDWGEVFNSKNINCDPNDQKTLHMYRSKGITNTQDIKCNVIHVPTIIRWVNAIRIKRNQHESIDETLEEMLTRRLTYDDARREFLKKTKFCGLVTLTTWKEMYAVDALVRHALCRLLTKNYKNCDALAAWKGALKSHPKTHPSDTYIIQHDYKFIIAMANEFSDGYLVEKTVHPYLAHSIAISGTPKLGQYINADRPVVCSIPKKALEHVAQWKRRGGSWMPFNSTPDDWKMNQSIQPIAFDLKNDEPLLEFVAQQWEKSLQPCIDEIIRLDKDDESYISKLREPFVANFNHSLFDGTYVGIAILNWLQHMKSPVVYGLDDKIRNLN
ncbi:hypothetical protein ACHAXR_004781 [Thalassiosira sp. AJA248-18]